MRNEKPFFLSRILIWNCFHGFTANRRMKKNIFLIFIHHHQQIFIFFICEKRSRESLLPMSFCVYVCEIENIISFSAYQSEEIFPFKWKSLRKWTYVKWYCINFFSPSFFSIELSTSEKFSFLGWNFYFNSRQKTSHEKNCFNERTKAFLLSKCVYHHNK